MFSWSAFRGGEYSEERAIVYEQCVRASTNYDVLVCAVVHVDDDDFFS